MNWCGSSIFGRGRFSTSLFAHQSSPHEALKIFNKVLTTQGAASATVELKDSSLILLEVVFQKLTPIRDSSVEWSYVYYLVTLRVDVPQGA